MVEGFLEGQYYFVGDEIENIQNFFFFWGGGLWFLITKIVLIRPYLG